ncbi:1,2-phenylacetyl-CoA epoxidase subunit PaaB [Candidatus Thalassolituus haligoni]|uniref:1,2-phenylacetyl-CoA epoxidase subunit PaaB n=1 Tax=Candidatus Thalassolituus haligoni TaxID=3100113 RepID=UPI0035168555|tara:strand:- start:27189 stop:27470 length:282 start_codon:yes stop_codon:yes gene_type:complete
MSEWTLFEVFVRSKHGLNHKHVGSVHAADTEMALENARDLYTRRSEGVSLWIVPSNMITASATDEKEALFDPSDDKVYRHASFYKLPDEVGHM